MTVKKLRDILKDFDDDFDVMTKKTEILGNIGEINSVRKDSYGFFGADVPCVLLTDEFKPQESEVIEDVNNQPTVEAISKADYEARLKADMVVMLDMIRAALIQSIQNGTLKIESGHEELFRILDKYKTESEEI